ncbi:MAG: NAD(P)/FAD-dependent oxidoreductase [Pseudonocardia sp.]
MTNRSSSGEKDGGRHGAGGPRVLIVGGGFAGLHAARRIVGSGAEITMLDSGTSHLFQPLLYQCATGMLSEGQITRPLRALLGRHREVRVVLGEAHDVDVERRVVTARRADATVFELSYDHLIVAAGMKQSYFGHPEFAAHAPGMKSIDDALTIRRKVLGAFEMAETLLDARQRRDWLTFAVAGAGPTGVELAGQIRELATRTIEHEFHRIDPAEARVLLFDGGDSVLRSFSPSLSKRALAALHGVGVETVLGVQVTDVDATGLVTTAPDGTTTRYDARTVLWTAGVEAVPFLTAVARATDVEQDTQGRIRVRPDLTVPGHPDIRVVGDVMNLDGLPGLAEVAMQSGRHAGAEIRARISDPSAPAQPFHYRNLGTAAYICRGHAVVEAGPLRLSGLLGWVAWGGIHIAFLAGVRNRFATVATWMLTLAFDRRAERALPGGSATLDRPDC